MEEALVDGPEYFYLRRKIHTQKAVYPVGLTVCLVDSEAINSALHRPVTFSGPFERLGLALSSPEDNLKTYRYPLPLCYLLLCGGCLSSLLLPLVFLAAFDFRRPGAQNALYWLFWSSMLELGAEAAFLVRGPLARGQIWKTAAQSELFALGFDAALYFALTLVVLLVCTNVENLFLLNSQMLALVLRCQFRLGRSISITPALLKRFLLLLAGTLAAPPLFRLWRPGYALGEGALAVLGGMLGGVLWLRNRELNSPVSVRARLTLFSACNACLALGLGCLLFGAAGLFEFFLDSLGLLALFAALRLLSLWLKTRTGAVFEDVIPSLAGILEPAVIFVACELVRAAQAQHRLASLFELLPKLALVAALLLGGQGAVLLEIKKNEMNLQGGKLGFRLAQRDRMREKHFEMLERLRL